jgi:hypothetical protein
MNLRSLKQFMIGVVFTFISVNFLQAHTYYEGLTDISVNPAEQRIEIVHRFTTHDLEILLSEKFDSRISADQKSYLKYIKQYIEEQFSISLKQTKLKINWVGVDNGVSETVIYQTVSKMESLSGMRVTNKILIGFFPEQINRTNYNDGQLIGTLIFDSNNQTRKIEMTMPIKFK